MGLIVEKYGGTSVGGIDRIKAVARRVIATQEKGYDVVVVVSAMGKTTDELLAMAAKIAPKPRQRELGMLLSTGEVISCSLLAMAIQALGKKAIALTGAQSGISTDDIYANARITEIDTTRIKKHLAEGEIVVVAGYQGKVGDEITVLGRGGSDASAVALAAALQAEYCHIYTDVPGVFTADPRIVRDASLLHGISYEEMIELAASGAQVMMGRAVEIARKYGLRVKVSSSFENSPNPDKLGAAPDSIGTGTIITREEELEKVVITGVAANKDVAMIDIYGVRIHSDDTAKILGEIATRQINIILMCSNSAGDHRSNLSLLVKPEDVDSIVDILNGFHHRARIDRYRVNTDVAQVSIVGSGIANHYGVAYDMFDVLSKSNIEVLMTSTSEIKITAIVPKECAELAISKLHEKFQLNHLQRNLLENKNG
ncbi:MAG: aspartate kinase [candidate division KSB1 bacterium]|nr:aspartate kinase [candidate division KSB1 bacterium]